jgi:hypothetical protein
MKVFVFLLREGQKTGFCDVIFKKMSVLGLLPLSYIQGGPDSIRQFLIINNQSIQQHTGKWESAFCCR